MTDSAPLVGAVLFLGMTALISTLLDQHRRTSRSLEQRCRELERTGSALRDHAREKAVTVQRLQAACEQAERKCSEAEQKAARSRDLNALTATLGDSVDAQGSAEVLVTRAPGALGCDASAVLLLNANGSGFEVLASRGIPRSVTRRIALTSLQTDTPHAAAIRDARTIRLRNRRDLAMRYEPAALSCVEPQTSALVVTPVVADGRVIGAFAVGYRAEQSFDGDEIETVELVADRLGRALARVGSFDAATAPLAG
jgi:transcriptional regulator with GAF, ATPase, and Fis domain